VSQGAGDTLYNRPVQRMPVGMSDCLLHASIMTQSACALLWSRHPKQVSCEVQLSKGTCASLQLPALCTVITGDMLAHENAVKTPCCLWASSVLMMTRLADCSV